MVNIDMLNRGGSRTPDTSRLLSATQSGSTPTWAALCVLIVAFVLHTYHVLPGLGNTLEGRHDFRQAQTAISTYYLEKDGLTFDYETPVLGLPASIPFEFPLYQFSVVGIRAITHLPLDVAGRLTSMGYFYLTLILIAITLRRVGFDRFSVVLAVAAILLSPVYTLYTRGFLIESTALFTSWLFLYVLAILEISPPQKDRPSKTRRALLVGLAIVFASIAAITKITTFAVHAGAAELIWFAVNIDRIRSAVTTRSLRSPLVTRFAVLALIVSAGMTCGIVWTHHTDLLKLRNPSPMAHHLTSAALMDWNFGAPGDLLHPKTWRALHAQFALASMGSFAPLGTIVFILPFVRRHIAVLVAMLLAFLSAPAVFTNLYAVHDYYWYANTVFFAATGGAALGTFLHDHARFGALSWWIPVSVFVFAQFFAYHFSPYYFTQKVPPHSVSDIAAEIKADTVSDASIVVFGFDWNSMIPYYAQRRALMVPWSDSYYFEPGTQQALKNLVVHGNPVGAVVFGGAELSNDDLQHRVIAGLPGRFRRMDLPSAVIYLRTAVSAGSVMHSSLR